MSEEDDIIEETLSEEEKDTGPWTFPLDDGSKVTLPVRSLSPSAVGTFRNCPRKYYYRYVEGLKIPPGIAQTGGFSGHATLAENNRKKRKTGKDLPIKKVLDLFRDDLATRAKDLEASERKRKDEIAGEILPSLEAYMDEVADSIVPVSEEQVIRSNFHGIPILGYADVVTKGNRVFDYKFCSKRSKDREHGHVVDSVQLSVYADAFGAKKVGHVCVVKGAATAEVISVERTPAQIEVAKEEFVHVARAVSAGAFPMCDPSNFLCSPKWCGYARICPRWKDRMPKE